MLPTEKDLQDEIIYLRKENVALSTKNLEYQKKIYDQTDTIRKLQAKEEALTLKLKNAQMPTRD
ncbi:MAG: hypothetical protein ACRDD8_11385 [Bacteroidales bacterium]